MKKLFLLILLFVFMSASSLWAQTKVITGTISSSVQGEGAIPGVTVQVKGTTIGATTDVNGKYSINVPESATTLVFSYIGMKRQEIAINGRSVIDGVMESDLLGLDEVVVTALGMTREKKALGYSVQDLGGDKIEKAKVSNIVNAFQGKLSGVQITNSDGGVASGVRVLIRGVNSLSASGNNQPLFIVDGVPINNSTTDAGTYGGRDYGNASSDINPSDVENISVLKGASAAALYGSRAVNGVILITTKSGKSQLGKQGLGVTFEQNMMWEKPLVLPKYQNLYGQGSADDWDAGEYTFRYVDGNYGGDYDGVDESWGPRLDGRLIPQFDSPYDPATGIRTPTPWIAHPDNVKSFFETGLRQTTSLAVAGAKQGADFRLSLSNQDIKGILPNTDLKKINVGINGNVALSSKLTFGGSASFISNKSDNIAENGYNGGNPMQSIAQWFGRQVDMTYLKENWDKIDPVTGLPVNWNHSYHNNPYWNMYKNTNSRNRDRMIGNINMAWTLTPWLSFKSTAGTDFSIEDIVERVAKGDVAIGSPEGSFDSYSNRRQEVNANARFEFNKTFGSIGVLGSIGSEYNRYNGQYRLSSVDELIAPDLYTVSNAAVPATTRISERHTELQSIFGTANLSYKNFVFLDLTGRNDWSSTLPVENNSYFYPSVSLSFILTDALGLQSNALSFLKLRASYAEVGGTSDPYALRGVFSASEPFNGSPSMNYTTTIPASDLKPQRKRSKEVGLEARFFQNRLGFDVALYRENTVNQIMDISISNATGFGTKTINAGNLQNTGLELQLNATPVQTNDFSWDITFNWSTNQNKVVELYKDMKYLQLYNLGWSGYVYAFPGQEYGVLYGYAIVRENAKPVYYDADQKQLAYYEYSGRPLISRSGRYIRSGQRTPLGNAYPDWFGGVNNSLTYKKLNLSFLVDFRKGSDIFSMTNMWGIYTGIHEETAAINANGKNIRDALDDGGGVLIDGVYGKVLSNGTIQYINPDGTNSDAPVQNETYVAANLWAYDYYQKHELSIFDGSFVKLREVSLSYSFDKIGFLNKVGVRDINLGVVGRNLAILHKNIPNIDPEVSSSAGNTSVGAETNSIPSTRSLGFNLRVNF